MTRPASLRRLGNLHRFDGELFALPRQAHEIVGGTDNGIKPVEVTEALGTEDESDIVSAGFDLGTHLRNLVLGQTERVRRFRRQFQHRHSNVLPALGAKCAREIQEHNTGWLSSYKHAALCFYGLTLFHYWNFATGGRAA